MHFVKKYLKFIIGIAVLIFAIIVFLLAQRSSNLESEILRNWPSASLERRQAAVKILTASDENTDLLVQCVDKIASLPESSEMAVKDAVSLCYTGLLLKENV